MLAISSGSGAEDKNILGQFQQFLQDRSRLLPILGLGIFLGGLNLAFQPIVSGQGHPRQIQIGILWESNRLAQGLRNHLTS